MRFRKFTLSLAGLALAVAVVGASLPSQTTAQEADIVDTAAAAGDFTTLLAAAEAAGLVDTLKGDGPFTVFAPTDDAFAALPAGTVEGLLADIPALTDVLLYHVVPGEVLAADVVGLSSAPTAQGSEISIAVVNGQVRLNDSVTVVATDVMASNGVIHVIDGVLLPPAAAPSDAPVSPAATGSAGVLADGGMGVAPWLLGVAALALVAGAALAVRRVSAR
jgi:uncharacterized surface protein with fasciclin (FAS1) repeats